MPYPNVYKKYSGEPGLGFLVRNGVQIGVDGGYSGYTVDYGPTNAFGYYQGIEQTNPYSNELTNGTVVFTSVDDVFSRPYYTFFNALGATPRGSQVVYANFVNSDYSEWSGVTLPETLQLRINQGFLPNSIVANYSLPTILTSGLTLYVSSNYLPCDWGLGDTSGTRTIYDVSLNQGQIGANNFGDAPRVRANTTWRLDGVDAFIQLTGTTNYATNNFTWMFGIGLNEPVPNVACLISSASGSQKNFVVSFQSANTSNCNIVIETSSSSYSSTTVGTNFDGYSGTGPATVSNAFTATTGYVKGVAIVKEGTTFSLYLSSRIASFETSVNTVLKWQATINDWNIVNSSLPTNIFFNGFTNDYTRGTIKVIQFYNRAMSPYEISRSLERFSNTFTGTQVFSGF